MKNRSLYTDDNAEMLKKHAGQKYRPSNGFEGDKFAELWCVDCKRSAAHRADPDDGDPCPIETAAFWHDLKDPQYPSEWQYGPDGQPRCTAHEPEAA
jgi:hypothetical protein